MARSFDVPTYFQSPIATRIKEIRRQIDPLKRDLSPSLLDFGPVQFRLARHFGFCFGVENAIEIVYRALEENPGKRLFLLSEMIHNPRVNEDLQSRGIRFLRTTEGVQLIPLSELTPDDIVIVPAFGTSVEIEKELEHIGLDVQKYNTTCPFVEKVWKRSDRIGSQGYTVVVHGKRFHEETRATFSHANEVTAVVVVRDLVEATELASLIRGDRPSEDFFQLFEERYSDGFDPERDLGRIGVVNQTTMLASDTAEIARVLKSAMLDRYGESELSEHFADTSDTLCYATNENQDATLALVEEASDLALVVGGTNSSNTGHLVEICAERMPTFFIAGASQIYSVQKIEHFDVQTRTQIISTEWLHYAPPVRILLTAGASCPDILLDEVIQKVVSCFGDVRAVEEVLSDFSEAIS